jgi:hypothetical protein
MTLKFPGLRVRKASSFSHAGISNILLSSSTIELPGPVSTRGRFPKPIKIRNRPDFRF